MPLSLSLALPIYICAALHFLSLPSLLDIILSLFDPLLSFLFLFLHQLASLSNLRNSLIEWMDPSNSQYQAMMNTHSSLQNVTLDCSNTKKQQEKTQIRPQPEALKCPRCDSGNTKFCYYNNYSLNQPRYFCKACRRYWTKGGSLRNVPVGGGCRKNHSKRSSSSSSSSSKVMMRSSTSTTTQSDDHQQLLMITNHNSNPLLFNLPNISSSSSSSTYDTNDLTLAFGRLHKQQTPTRQLGFDDHANTNTISTSIFGNPKTTHFDILGNPNTTNSTIIGSGSGFLDALRSGFLDAPSSTNGFHNFYNYGNMGEVENNGNGVASNHDQQQEMGLPYEEINSAILASSSLTKEELLKGAGRDIIHGDQNRILWNFPWQQFGDHQEGINMGNVDSSSAGTTSTGRDNINQCWNNGSSLGSSWHGLVNTTL